MAHPSLSRLLAKDAFPEVASKHVYERRLEDLQRRMLLIQQGCSTAAGAPSSRSRGSAGRG